MTETRENEAIEQLQAAIGYTFNDIKRLQEALTHRSFVNETKQPNVRDNERLEFLGDAVIDLVVSTALMRRFPEAREGALSRMRADLVNENGLATVAAKVQLGLALRLGRGEELSGGRDRASLLADAFEAVIAAVYLDGGLQSAEAAVLAHLDLPDDPATQMGDPKTQLQERIQAERHVTPTYRVVDERGPDHSKVFEVEIICEGAVLGVGEGRTKKEAEQAAAAAVLRALPATTEAD